jgi:hypothetical protein
MLFDKTLNHEMPKVHTLLLYLPQSFFLLFIALGNPKANRNKSYNNSSVKKNHKFPTDIKLITKFECFGMMKT